MALYVHECAISLGKLHLLKYTQLYAYNTEIYTAYNTEVHTA